MIRYSIFFTILLTFSILSSNAQEQIVFVSERDGNQEIYRMIGGNIERLTFTGERVPDFDPSLSPDGTKIAFVSGRIGKDFEIYIIDTESRKQHRLTFSVERDLYPSWSPDGERIAFASERDGDFDIYIMDEDGQNLTQLTDSPGDDISPDWSPDGKKIVFTSDRDEDVAEVYLLDIQTGLQRRLTDSVFVTSYPKWSPDGTQIAFISAVREEMPRIFRQIWLMKIDGTDLEALAVDGERNDEPSFSPDGRRIAFTSRRNDNTDIYSINRDTRLITRLTHHPADDYGPDWSPNGEKIIFVSSRSGNSDIYIMNSNGGQIMNLTKSEASERMPAWSLQGDKIAFVRSLADGKGIYVMDSDGRNQVKLTDEPFSALSPTWSPQGDKIAFVNYPDREVECSRIYTIDIDGQNKQLLFEEPSGIIRKISWSPDGRQIIFIYSKRNFGHEIRLLNVMTRKVSTIDVLPINTDNVAWSPTGEEIAFSTFPPVESPQYHHGIFFMDDIGNIQRIILETPHLPFDFGRFAWSPDGQKILFSSNENLYLLDLGSERIELFIESASSPDWKGSAHLVSPQNKLKTTWGEIKRP